LFGSSFLSFVYCTGPDPRAQEFSTFSFPQSELSCPSRGRRFAPIFVFLQLEHAPSPPALVAHQIALNSHTCRLADAVQSCVGVTQESFAPEARRLVPLILFATARRHWSWLCDAIERHCQFSREACLHRAKKNEGSCTPSLGYYYSAHWQVTHSSGCMCARGGRGILPLPHGGQKSAARPASCWRSVCSKLGNR